MGYYSSTAKIGLYITVLFLVVVGLDLLFTGQGEQFNVGKFLMQTDPYMWGILGMSLCVGLSVVGAGM